MFLMVTVERHESTAAVPHREQVLAVWEETFGAVHDHEQWSATVWDRHRSRSGFRLVTAYELGELIGFAWGYTGEPGQYWSDLILDRLGAAVAPWVGGHFEFVELAVRPDGQGRGIGGALHDALLSDLPHERALLGTVDDPVSPAVRLYRRRGWVHLGKHTADDQVMGKVLRP